MAYKIVAYSKAKNNIRAAYSYYEKQQNGLGERFLKEIEKTKKSITRFPYASSIVYNQTIVIPVKVFPYGLQILINEEIKTVIILSVCCFKQDPDVWTK